jgi:hypothetical protein
MELYRSFHEYILKDKDLQIIVLTKIPFTTNELHSIAETLTPRALTIIYSVQTFCSIFILTDSSIRTSFSRKHKTSLENILKICFRLMHLITPQNTDTLSRFQYIPLDFITVYHLLQDITSLSHQELIKEHRETCYGLHIVRTLFDS